MSIIGKYKCLKCGHEWEFPIMGTSVQCMKCKYIYVEWLNYEKLEKLHNWTFENINNRIYTELSHE